MENIFKSGRIRRVARVVATVSPGPRAVRS
jgi:hypothetical protein